MQPFFILLILEIAVIAVQGQADAVPKSINCRAKAEDVCERNATCRFTCRYPCCNTGRQKDIHVVGSGTYSASSSICKSAFHDLRFPPGRPKDVVIRRFHAENCFLEGSVAYGFASEYGRNKSCDVFEFEGSRVSESLLDVVSMHSNFLYEADENHTQCCPTDPTQKTRFVRYDQWPDCGSPSRDVVCKAWPPSEFGAFQCFANLTALSLLTSVAFPAQASFLPESLTLTANLGEDVLLSMNETDPDPDRGTAWKKDGVDVDWMPVRRTELSLRNVRPRSSGVYSLSYAGGPAAPPGFLQLIVRRCPRGMYGTKCDETCLDCFNGGICHDITGQCVCAPGFRGSSCEKACPAGYVGQRCSIECSSAGDQELCRGLLMCLPSPYGCSCAAGYTGLRCDQECEEPFYGAGCSNRHRHVHYEEGSCSRFEDACDCLRGWHGHHCNTSYPVLRDPPYLTNATESSVVVSFRKWSESRDGGEGLPHFYQVVYKGAGDEEWQRGPNVSAAEEGPFRQRLEDLRPGSEYRVAVVVVVDRDGSGQEADLREANFTTDCDAPSRPPSNVELHSDEQRVYVGWELPLREQWNCQKIDSIVRVREKFANLTKECSRKDETSCSFESEPYVTWFIEVCASSGVDKENCATARNITIVGTLVMSPLRIETVQRATSLSLSWAAPEFSNRLRRYEVRRQDLATNVSESTSVRVREVACDPGKGNYHCYTLRDLTLGHRYRIEIVAFYSTDEGMVIESVEVDMVKPASSVAVAVAVCLPLLLGLFIIALLLLMQKRKRRKSAQKVKFLPNQMESEFAACNEALDEMDIIDTESMSEELSNPVAIESLPRHVKQGIQNVHIRKEFMSVPTGQIYPSSVAKLTENKAKNRYGNILPYDHSRVILATMNGEPCSSYIHASYIHGYNKVKKYIATQGPLPNTVVDFWRMVWDEGCRKILMITNFMENGKYKCEKYWSEGSCQYGDVAVSLQETKTYADFIIRTFHVSKGDTSREVKHFHFTTWPDHGAPSNTAPFRYYLDKARSYEPDSDPPVVVHCSAGIGRTGATILLDSMLDMGREEKQVDLVSHLCSMRKQRMNIVENFDQYVFVYSALVEALCLADTCVRSSDFKRQSELIEKQFKALNESTPELMQIEVQGAYQRENIAKNRYMRILPPDRARPFLSRDSTAYINAVFVDSFTVKKAYIATQYPLPETVEDFWSMVYGQRCKTVVLLQRLDSSQEAVPELWSSGGVLAFDDFQVTWKSQTAEQHLSIVDLDVSPRTTDVMESLEVKVVELLGWASESDLPPDPSVLLSALRKVNPSTGAITAVCADGVRGCGVFCACLYVLDQLKAEPEELNVMHAVKCIRANRPHFVLNLAQCEFIFEVVQSYGEAGEQ